MWECNTFTAILDGLQSRLPIRVPVIPSEADAIPIDFDFMKSGATFKSLQRRPAVDRWTRLVGLLFSHPAAPLTQSEIIPHLTHFHLRSNLGVDFFCMGYGADWPPEHYVDRTVVAKMGERTWLFSEHAFSEAIDELKRQTLWTYSGECELVLLAAVARPEGAVRLTYETAIVCNLEAMLRDNAITSVRAFFTSIFDFSNSAIRDNVTWALSDVEGAKVAKDFLRDTVLNLLPTSVAKGYRKARHVAIRDISKR